MNQTQDNKTEEARPEDWKVWQMNDCDFIFARTKEEAVRYYLLAIGCKISANLTAEELLSFEGAELDEVHEMTPEELNRWRYREDEDREKRSYAEQLVFRRTGELKVDFFATTEC